NLAKELVRLAQQLLLLHLLEGEQILPVRGAVALPGRAVWRLEEAAHPGLHPLRQGDVVRQQARADQQLARAAVRDGRSLTILAEGLDQQRQRLRAEDVVRRAAPGE